MRLGGVAAEEDRAGVPDAVGQRLRVVHGELDVLGRDAGRPGAAQRPAAATTTAPWSRQDARGVRAGGQRGDLRLDRGHHGLGEGRVVGDQDRLGVGVVLGLGEQVGGDPGRDRWRRRPPPRSPMGPARASMPTTP